ncbi:MAG: hypothetical protein ACTSVY_01400 [Candidatus Helarchaeota archaeon]
MFGTKFDNLSELEKDIFYEVISAEEGIGDKEIAEIAKKFNITEKKVENILSKLEKDGYLESEDE